MSEIVSGCILVWSVFKIRAFMLATQTKTYVLNVKSMCLHASSFGLYTLSLAVFTVFQARYLFDPSKEAAKASQLSQIAMFIFSFFSQCLLCVIFLQVNTKTETTETKEDEESSSAVTIKVEDFDEDAELQARIWNSFTRAVHGVRNTVNELSKSTVTAQQIMRLSYAAVDRRTYDY